MVLIMPVHDWDNRSAEYLLRYQRMHQRSAQRAEVQIVSATGVCSWPFVTAFDYATGHEVGNDRGNIMPLIHIGNNAGFRNYRLAEMHENISAHIDHLNYSTRDRRTFERLCGNRRHMFADMTRGSRIQRTYYHVNRPQYLAARIEMRAYGRGLARAMAMDDDPAIIRMLNAMRESTNSSLYYSHMMDAINERNYITCGNCSVIVDHENGETVYTSAHNHEQWCHHCAETHTVWSTCMDGPIPAYSACGFYDEDDNSDYATSDWLRANGYREQRSGSWVCASQYRQDYDNACIYGYHNGPEVGHIPSKFDSHRIPMHAGIEIEIETSDEDDNSDVAYALAESARGYAKFEEDGSLDNGFEIITGYTGLDTHEKRLKELCAALAGQNVRSASTHTCGLHVHIDRAGLDPFHAGKLLAFMHAPKQRNLIESVARRYDGHYAHVNEYKASKITHEEIQYSMLKRKEMKQLNKANKSSSYPMPIVRGNNRYEVVNLTNENTIEFRCFKGSISLVTIMASIEFSRMVWFFTQFASIKQLNTANFCAFIQQPQYAYETRYLRHYLGTRSRFAFKHLFEHVPMPGSIEFVSGQKVVHSLADCNSAD